MQQKHVTSVTAGVNGRERSKKLKTNLELRNASIDRLGRQVCA